MSPPAELVDELPFLALILVVVVLLPCTVLFRQVCVGRIGVAAARESMFVKIAPDLPCDAALEAPRRGRAHECMSERAREKGRGRDLGFAGYQARTSDNRSNAKE